MDIYLTKKTKKNLEAIYKFSMKKYLDGKIEKEPTRAEIIRRLIDDLHEVMVEDGQL